MTATVYSFGQDVPLGVGRVINELSAAIAAGGAGTVTSVSVTTANGVSGSVATATTTPAITLNLGAITPASVAAVGAVSGSNLSGTNTGDQTSVSGNAGTATALQTGRAINGVTFDGTAPITVTAAAGTLTGATLAAGVTASSLTSVGTLASLTVTNPITGSVTGNAATVTTNANLTGNVTSVGNATTIANSVVTEAMQLLADNTTGNVSASAHGYAPKVTDTTKFLKGDGTWATPASSEPDIATSALAPSTDESIDANLSALVVRSYTIASGKKLTLGAGSRFRVL